MAEEETAPVIIAGGGLVGLSSAVFLAQHGVRSIAVERLKTTSTLPRAAFFHMRTFELFRSAGIEDQVREQSEREFTPDGAVVGVETLSNPNVRAFIPSLNEGVEELSPCRRWFVSQPGLEPILRRRAEQAGASVIAGHEVTQVAQDADGVTVTVRHVDGGAERRLRGKYLIAADGGRSQIRETLGFRMDGRGVFSNSITIYFRADLSPYLARHNFSIIYVNNAELGGFFRLDKDSKRGFLAVNYVGDPGADPVAASNAAADVSEARQIALVRAAAGNPDLAVELEGCARWRATADLAERYRDGRIFLVGDAVHLMPPTGGFGGNTGIHDAHNLAWKIAMVLNGAAGAGLLESYEAERRPAGRLTVEQAYTRYVTRTAPYLGAKDYAPLIGDFDIELGYLYRSGAIVTEPGTPEGHEDPRLSRGRPGSRAPHLWLEKKGGRVSTLDLIGNGFTLMSYALDAGWRMAAENARSAMPQIPLAAVEIDDPQFCEHYGLDRTGACLVRPDGFVAWRAPSSQGDLTANLVAALRQLLCQG